MKKRVVLLLIIITSFSLACADQEEKNKGDLKGIYTPQKVVADFTAVHDGACNQIGELTKGQTLLTSIDFNYKKGEAVDSIKARIVQSVLEAKQDFLKYSQEGTVNGTHLKSIITETCDNNGNCHTKAEPKIEYPIPVVQSCPQEGNPINFQYKTTQGVYKSLENPNFEVPALQVYLSWVVKRKCADGVTYEETFYSDLVYSMKHRQVTNQSCRLLMVDMYSSNSATNGTNMLYSVTNLPLH